MLSTPLLYQSFPCEKAGGSEWARPLESESMCQQREMYELVDSGQLQLSIMHNDVGEGGLKIFFYILCLSCSSCLFDLERMVLAQGFAVGDRTRI